MAENKKIRQQLFHPKGMQEEKIVRRIVAWWKLQQYRFWSFKFGDRIH